MFSVLKLQINRGTTTSNSQGGNSVTVTHTYKDTSLTVGTIRTLFPDYLNQGVLQDFIFVGDHMLVEGSDTTIYCKILSLAPFTLGADLFSGASGLSIGPTIAAVDNNAAVITGDTLQMEIADATHAGIVTEVAQDFGGVKTFHEDIIIDNPTNGLIILKTVGSVGVEMVTSDTNATPGFVFSSTNLPPGNFYGMLFREMGFSLPNPQLYVVAGNNAGIVLDNVDQSVTINNTLKTDNITENTPANGTVINGANLINGGIQFLPVQTLLRTYIEADVFFSFTNGALTTAPVLFRITKIGNIVTMNALGQGITGAQATPDVAFFSNSVLNTLYRPSVAPVTGYWRVFNVGTGSIGMVKILLDGTIAIYNNADETTAFTAGVNNIFDSGTFTYNVN